MKDTITKILKKGEKSTTEISNLLKRNYYDAVKTLKKLEEEGVIEKIKAGKFTFWRLKK